MIAERHVTPAVAAEDAGFSYLATEAHYHHLAARIGGRLGTRGGFIRIIGETSPDGELLLRCLEHRRPGGFSFLYCRPGASSGEMAGGAPRVLILGEVDAIPDDALLRLCDIAQAREPAPLPVILLTTAAFGARLRGALQGLAPLIDAELRLEELDSAETGAFIACLMGELGHEGEDVLPADTVAAIAASAAGDPAAVSRLARGTLDFRRRTGARLSPARSAGGAQPAPASEGTSPTPSSTPASPPSAASGPDESALVISLADFADEWRRLGDRAGRNGDSGAPPATPLELTTLAEPATKLPRRRIGMAAAAIALVIIAGSGAAYLAREHAAALVPTAIVAENPPAAIATQPSQPSPQPQPQHSLPREWPPAVPTPPALAIAKPPIAHPEAKAVTAANPARIADRHDGDRMVAAAAPKQAADRHDEDKAVAPAAPRRVADRHDEKRMIAAAAPRRVADRHDADAKAAAPKQVADHHEADATVAAAAPKRIADHHAAAGVFGVPKALLAQIVAALAPSPPPKPPAAPHVAPVAPPAAAPSPAPEQRLTPEEIALCLRRGEDFVRQGDITSARLYFQRAAADGDATAARRLARTYDPLALRSDGVRGVPGNRAEAVRWYRKAVERGDTESKLRLSQLLAGERRR